MDPEITVYRCASLAIGSSIMAQVVQMIGTVSPGVGGWFTALASLLLIGIGIATFLRFQLSQWLLDGMAIALGIAGGVWL